ncbi:glycerol-3-phosphate 1-O-acyltransferase PlsY [Legionella oakridgensis]|uniref:Glycerol-3-phosphate acyltransferase n=2 Tax=Legionella oakridgensis TaxID=29423 RepID=W0BCJ8_9GAMM|nr:glycerol-3-phosphate 1-O-acyltransferase PlsY [Legionella oakridgensis]AHE66337.1 acyl-phosphate glycerol 3-phosphate acyltransferase [Legionella oakridgensis ATCC 33761 = DSM 21215]ETO93845.1 acyl-phosphate glycerol-3-phosphate acyltransferase [Legionella oakridgensis RV-2-2007]KTD43982.1 transmembrane protein [Legionella oakridgensis]STY19523.1 transmembrane protein [Legionella longbeachae]
MVTALLFIFCMVVAYLVGSICSAVIVCRIFALPDPRMEGSQNPGATNVLRIAGKQYAVIVLIADMLKGLLPVLLAKLLGAGAITVSFTCLAAVLGHMYPIFFDFKGGKGVATALGALLGLHLMLGTMVIATWLIIANFSRYSSLASITAILFAPFYSLFVIRSLDAFLPLMSIAIFILYKHRRNITRLIDGNEPKIIFRRQPMEQNVNLSESDSLENSDEPKPITTAEVILEQTIEVDKPAKLPPAANEPEQ